MAGESNWSSGVLPSQVRLAASTLLTRLPVSMVPLSLLLLVVDQTDSYTWAGLTAGAHVAGYALAHPVITHRYVKVGFFGPMLACSVVYPLLAAVVIALAYSESTWWLAFPAAGAMGAALPVTHHVLAGAWRRLGEESDERRRTTPVTTNPATSTVKIPDRDVTPTQIAFSTRVASTAVADAGALLGPLFVAAVVAGSSAGYAVGIAALAALVGSWLLISDPHAAGVKVADPRQGASTITQVRSAESRSHLLGALLVSGAAALAGLGVVTVTVVGFARYETGHPALAGVFLALWAIGGFVGGVWYGSMAPGADEQVRYRWTLLLVVLAHLPLIFVDRVVVLMVLLPVVGALAAAHTSAYTAVIGVVARRVGAGSIRTRIASTSYLGFGIGLAVGGIAVGQFSSASVGFAVCVGVLVIALLVGTLGSTVTKQLRKRNSRTPARHSRRG